MRNRRSDELLANDIVTSVDRILRWTGEVAHDDLYRAGVLRELAVIGEAAKSLSEDFKNSCQGIPWRAIAGQRDVAIHKYWNTEWARVETTISEDLPLLKDSVVRAMRQRWH